VRKLVEQHLARSHARLGLDHDGLAGELLLELTRRAFGDDPAPVDDREPVRQHIGLLEVVRSQEDRGAGSAQPPQLVPQVRAVLRVEPGRWLVQEQNLGPVHDPERDLEPAALPARVRERLAVDERPELEQLGQGACGGLAHPVQLALEQQVLAPGGRPVCPAERLLEAALDVFSARGFAGGRVQEIADRAGVNAQLISYYFGGKEGLYRAL